MRVFKTEIKPNEDQKIYLSKCFGFDRYAYNRVLSEVVRPIYDHNCHISSKDEAQHYPSGYDLRHMFKKMDHEDWVYELPSKVADNSVLKLARAISNFKNKNSKAKFPRFKSRKSSKRSFKVDGAIYVERHRIKLPKMEWIPLKEYGYLPTTDREFASTVTVTECAGRYFVSVMYSKMDKLTKPLAEYYPGNTIGIDLGVKTFVTLSDGTRYKNINKAAHVRRIKKRITRVQRQMSRRYRKGQRQSNSYMKAKRRFEKLHFHLANIRKEYTRQIISEIIARKPSAIIIEDLNVSGMMKNSYLSKAVQECSFYYFRLWLEHQCSKYGINFIVADCFFPSSKLCSSCGSLKKDLSLSDRVYICSCGYIIDRDVNAAINLANYKV